MRNNNNNNNNNQIKNMISTTPLKRNNSINIPNISIFLLFFISTLVIGSLLFFNGFLLMRFELPLKSKCNELPITIDGTGTGGSNINGCWMDKIYNKAVIIVIDALRYDFVEKQATDNNNNNNGSSTTSIYFHNRLKSIQNLIENKSENTLFFKFVADSPTVTMQRIKGITTGSLPTFIDVGSNFGGDAIVEDSLVNQLSFNDDEENDDGKKEQQQLRNKVIFIGDDTWVSLFPNHFYSEYPYPSFNVKDIDTVDNGVIEHLLPTITQLDDNAWDITIAHLLGVDHVGHTYGPYHPEMIRKLNQMDDFLLTIINNIKNDTLLILMGDHGMTSDGNHGGASLLETDAALFMYSPGIKINSSRNIPKEIIKSRLSSVPLDHYNNHIPRDISQIDLVSTLSLALGVPIPFGNLGSIIPELFFSVNSGGNDIKYQWNTLFNALRINTFQIKRYIEEYSKISKDFPISKLEYFQKLLDKTEKMYNQYQTDSSSNSIDPIEIYKGYIQYHQEVIELCRYIWATFNLFSMNCGILLIFTTIISIVIFTYKLLSIKRDKRIIEFPFKKIGISIGYGLILSSIINIILSKLHQSYSPKTISITIPTFITLIYFIKFSINLTTTTTQSITQSIQTVQSKSNLKFLINFIPFVTFILHGFSFHSNSFIESQQSVVYFILFSNFIFATLNVISSGGGGGGGSTGKNKMFTILFIITTISLFLTSPLIWNLKISSFFTNTSEQQQEVTNIFIESFWVIPIIFYLWRYIIFKEISTTTRNKTPIIHEILLTIILISISIYWFLIQPLISSQKYQFNWIEKSILPWIIYISSLIGLYKSIFSNNLIIMIKKKNPVELLLKKLVYTSSYFYLIILLLLGIENSRSTLLMLLQTILIIKILSSSSSNSSNSSNGLFLNISIIFGFLSINHFFTSGHEYSFNKIQFDSAFIGFENHFYLRDAILILLNTFSSPIFFTLSLPIAIIYIKFNRLLKIKQLVVLLSTTTSSGNSGKEKEKELLEIDEFEIKSFYNLSDILISFLFQLLFFSYQTLHICISVYVLRRHLMVWRVFAPKYIFETVQLLVVSFFLLLLSIIIYYIQKKQISFCKTFKQK